MRIWCGIDMGKFTNSVALLDRRGSVVQARTLPNDLAGAGELLEALRASSHGRRCDVTVALEDPHGLLPRLLADSGYPIIHVLPAAAAEYRRANATSGAKSDSADARLLADMIRLQPHAHRRRPELSDELVALRLLTRAHQDAIRRRTDVNNRLRAVLDDFYPAAASTFRLLWGHDAVTALRLAPTPTAAAALSSGDLAAALASLPRRERLERKTARILDALRCEQMRRPAVIEQAQGAEVRCLLRQLQVLTESIDDLGTQVMQAYAAHPLSPVFTSFPGLAKFIGARMLAEIGDDLQQYHSARGVQAAAGTVPVTRTSGLSRRVQRRLAYNRRLGHAANLWVTSLTTGSPAAHAHYARRRAAGDAYAAAVRNVANRWLGILWHCMSTGEIYDETKAACTRTSTAKASAGATAAGC